MEPSAVSALPGAANAADDAVAVLLHIDSSSLRSDDAPDVCVSLFDTARVCMDLAVDLTLVLGFERAIYLTHRDTDAAKGSPESYASSLHVIVDAQTVRLKPHERVADVTWLDSAFVCVGYTTGIVRLFTRSGALVFEQQLHRAAVHTLTVNRDVATMAPRRATLPSQAPSEPEPAEFWVLYADATVVVLQVSEVIAAVRAGGVEPAQVHKVRKYSLRGQTDVVAAVPCGPVRPTIFQSHARLGVYTIVSAGSAPFLSFYPAGNDQNSIIHLAQIATAIASRAAGAAWRFATTWGWRRGTDETLARGDEQRAVAAPLSSDAIDSAVEHMPTPLGSTHSIDEDERRRCRVLVLSPSGKLAAVSDSLGRIVLIDTSRMVVIRMWKGYRNGQCGWMQGLEGARRPLGLYLVIYSAQRGIVEVWRARYGPRVFSFAVGNCAKLFTQFDSVTRRTKCYILTKSSGTMSEVIELKPRLPNASTLMKYFTQNKLQEEQFRLHQVVGSLHAFVKKNGDHTHEHNTLNSLLEDMRSFSALTTIQALLDVLLKADMRSLDAAFLLRALENLQLALKNEVAFATPTGASLSLQWKLLWQYRLVSTFIGFQTEFASGKHAFMSMLQTSDREILLQSSTSSGCEENNSPPFSRVMPWYELYRRAGLAFDDESCIKTCRASDSASQLTAWEFMEFFSMPFDDPDLPRRRDIISLFETAETDEHFLRDAFRVLGTPLLRKFSTLAHRNCFLTFIFAPVLSSVFAVQELQRLHSTLYLTEGILTKLFVDWYFSLPLGMVLALPSPSSSSSLQRWLQPYFVIADVEEAIGQEGDNVDVSYVPTETRVFRLRDCHPSVVEFFDSCCKTPKLFHAFVLSAHCGWSEKQSAKHAEEATFGKYSIIASGVRWAVLQECIAKTMHLSLRLGKAGCLSVDAVEHVDDVMQRVAVMQLNDGHEVGEDDAAVQLPEDHADVDVDGDETDGWVASMEDCRKAADMRDWAAVMLACPQLSSKDALCCCRVETLCTTWNAERSDMRQIEGALLELDCVQSLHLKVAMAAHIWERYIRVHVATLVTFWEESAAGRKPQRGLQAQVARRFFGIIRNLLAMLLTSVQTISTAPITSGMHDKSDVEDEASEGDESCDDDNELPMAEYKMRCLTQPCRWHLPVNDLHVLFRQHWPPSYETSMLIKSLRSFKLETVSASQIADHTSLIMLLDSFAATAVTPVSIAKLFSNQGHFLCCPDSFQTSQLLAQPSAEEMVCISENRVKFSKELLRHDETLGFALAEAFGLSSEVIREEHVLFLYQSGRDERADFAIERMRRPERLVSKLGSIARARLSLILQRMKTEAEYAVLMSMLPADVFAWVLNDTQPPLAVDALVEKLDLTPSLTSTHYLLLKCLSMMVPTGEEFEKVSAMSVLVKDVISQVKPQS